MKNLISKTKAFLTDEQGAETVEWIMVTGMVVGIIVAISWNSLRVALNGAVTTIVNCMAGDCTP